MSTLLKYHDYTRTFADVYLAELDYVIERRKKINISTETVESESARLRQELATLQNDKLVQDVQNSEAKSGISRLMLWFSDRFRRISSDEIPRFNVKPSTKANVVGLALSGGGIRSATFNFGLLQSLAKNKILQYCDYLSTVSGGGYIGSCLTSLLAKTPEASTKPETFPLRHQRDGEFEERAEVNHLRNTRNYLGLKLDPSSLHTWKAIAMYLSGLILVNLTAIIFILIVAYALFLIENPLAAFYFIPQVNEMGEVVDYIWKFDKVTTFFNYHSLTGFLLQLAGYTFVGMVIAGGLPAFFNNLNSVVINYLQAWLGVITIILIVVVGLVTFTFYLFLDEYGRIDKQISTLLIYTLLMAVLFFILGRFIVESKFWQRLIYTMSFLALIALFPIVFAKIFRLLWLLSFFESVYDFLPQLTTFFPGIFDMMFQFLPMPIFAAGILFILSLMVNINNSSQHAFYRNGLSKTFLIKRKNGQIESNDNLILKELHAYHNGPYHLINATLNVQASNNRFLHGRGADYFLFSKYYCGTESTGYRNTTRYNRGQTELATAMAVSGAAASPQMGTQSNFITALLMVVFNIRLNLWMPNPNPKWVTLIPIWPYYLLKEVFQKNVETDALLNLSDGGHHENLGVYPLLKRRCSVIIVSDAGADPNFQMDDFANLQHKARIDLGIDIDLDVTDIRPKHQRNKLTNAYFIKGSIHYPNGEKGILFYIKTTMTGNEPEYISTYRRKSPTFPDETTADQFFVEDQFECYRKLGNIAGNEVFSEIEKEIQKTVPTY